MFFLAAAKGTAASLLGGPAGVHHGGFRQAVSWGARGRTAATLADLGIPGQRYGCCRNQLIGSASAGNFLGQQIDQLPHLGGGPVGPAQAAYFRDSQAPLLFEGESRR